MGRRREDDVVTVDPSEPAWVCMASELVGGQVLAAAPAGQLVVVVGRISNVAGEKAQEDSVGRPAQESVTNMGAVSAELLTGIRVTTTDPDWPGVSVNGNVPEPAGVTFT